jgi:hypothetical protein
VGPCQKELLLLCCGLSLSVVDGLSFVLFSLNHGELVRALSDSIKNCIFKGHLVLKEICLRTYNFAILTAEKSPALQIP